MQTRIREFLFISKSILLQRGNYHNRLRVKLDSQTLYQYWQGKDQKLSLKINSFKEMSLFSRPINHLHSQSCTLYLRFLHSLAKISFSDSTSMTVSFVQIRALQSILLSYRQYQGAVTYLLRVIFQLLAMRLVSSKYFSLSTTRESSSRLIASKCST